MAKASGRRAYKRDNKGQFSGSGSASSGGSSKAGATRAANTARSAALKRKGTVALGSRVKPKGFSGGKAAQQRAGGLRQSSPAAKKVKSSFRSGAVSSGGKLTKGQAQMKSQAKAPAASKPAVKRKGGNAPAAIRALAAVGVGAFTAGQMARAKVRQLTNRRRKAG